MRQNRKISAVVYSRLVFNSSSPVPSEILVLSATGTLFSSRRANLSDSTEVLNVTYDKISETSYAIIFTFNVTNISMPESTVLMNDTNIQVKNSVNIALNTLLNEPSAELFEPQRSDFRMLANQVEGNMEYSFQEGDTKTPITFLNKLKTQSASPTTVSPMATSNLIVTSAATPSKISTSAVVYSRLVFNSSSPVPTESLVLNATNTLLKSRHANLSDSTKVLNVTYEKISETSYAVIFTFNISDISMPESTVLMNDTNTQVKNSVNIALNTLLNEPTADLFEPQRSDFRMLANQVEGNMEYSFQEGDTKTPISFLNELKTQSVSTTTVSPMTTSTLIVMSAATPSKISTPAVVYSRLVFNFSSPVPSESLVLNATNTLLNSRRANLSDSTKVLNVTYEKISETSYAVIFLISISNISMPESTVLMNDTNIQVKNSVNIALNTLLNEPTADLFEPQRSDFRMLANQVEGNMEYSFQEGDTKTPISFLNELKTQSVSTTTVSPMTTSTLIVTSAAIPSKISTPAVVYSRLVFNSSSPVPSESLVLNATNTLLNSRRANLSDSTKVLNVTYEKISETSYAVIFTFSISNISMPESTVLMNDTYTQVKNSVNIALNTLLNEPTADLFEPQRSDFRILANQVEGNMEYSFQEGDTKTPISFLNELKTQSVSTTTVSPMTTSTLIVMSAATPSKISTPAVVYSRLVFNSSSPVPSESLVLNATNTLLNSRRANLSDSTKVLNVTYEKISETSYAVIFTFSISNISMPENTVLMNDTYTQVKNSVNIALNTLLNEPTADLFEPQRSDFRILANQVEGNMEYSFQEGDTKTPISFLNELKTQSVSTTTVSPMTTSTLIVMSAATPSKISTPAVVYSRLVFNSSSPVPSESLVLNATNTLLNSRRANLSDSTKVLNVTYEKISETSYAVIFLISISNISMPESTVLMNDTNIQVKNSVNIALNTLLNEPTADLFEPQRSDFRMLANQVEGNMEYSFQEGDTKTPISFLNELKTQSVSTTTVSPMTTSTLIVTSAATPSKISTPAVVYSRLVFNSSSPVPSESLVLNATNTLLNSRRANLSDSTKVLNVTYEKISETSYAVIFTFSISNISMPESTVLMNDTYTQVKNSVNIALNTLLNEPTAEQFRPQRSDFRMLANQVEGNMEYSFQEGDTKTPISFLNELKTQSVSTTTVSPMTTSTLIVTSAATPSKISTSAVVYSRLVFNSSSPVPSESLVLNATNTLLNSRRANLSDSTKVLNVTYEKISETSYVVIFTFSISNISMPESTVLMNDTNIQVKNSVNIALNTLLNKPSAELFEPQRSDFRMLANQVEGNMEYSFQEGDTKTPISFLNELKTQSVSTTTVSPITTSILIVTSAATPSKISTPAVVYSRLVFNSSSPVPSESLVLNATNTLLNSRRANLSDSTKVLNVTYDKISETSYAVIFTFSISNISMPESTVLMNDTYTQVKNSVNIALNTLLNEPTADLFEPQRSDFRMLANQVEGNMEYSFQEGDTKTPISFLNELKTQSASPTTVSPMATSNLIVTSAATPSKISTSAVVYSRMVFNSSSPVPTESLVLNATNTLLNSRRANLSDSIKVLNVTYEKISETSYAVIFTFNISDISMPESTVLMNDTYTQVKNSVNIALNTLLNEPSADLFEPQRSDFRMLANQVEGNMEYSFQEGDTKTPITFLNELKTQSASPTTVSPMATSNLIVTSAATPSKISTSAVVYSRMVFNSSSPVPTESLVLNATNTLLNSRRANLSDSIKVLNVTYEKISETSYAVIFTFNISDISMPESTVLMNDTYTQVKNSVNIALNTLLNEPSADLFEPQRSDFRMLANQVEGNMEYSFQEGDTKTPITFLNELKTQSASPTTVSPMATSNLIVTSAATPSKISTSAVVYSRMVFNSSSPVPTESLVLNATNTLLNSRRANLSDSIKVLNVTYEKISETSYAVIFTFNISDISMPESTVLMNDTYTQVKNSVNIALNTLLNEPSADLFEPQRSDFRMLANQVEGNMEYSFQEGDTKTPITFLNELKTQSASPTTVSPMATSNLIVTSAATPSKISTSAVVYSRMVFNSSSPVPTESLVLNATNTLLNSRRANLSDSIKVLNVTYEKISETSYAVIFTFNISDISMPESTVLMNDTYTQVKNSVNIALNTLLNEPSADLFEPQRSDFRMLANQVEGNMEYSFQEGDTKTPITFLNELKTQSASPTTVSPMATSNLIVTSAATPSKISTSAVVYSRMVFNSSSPVPTESLVLNATNTLLNSRRANLSDSIKVLNVTYEKISETSYAVIFTFNISDISMPESTVLMNDTYTQVKNSVNIALNTLLNEPSADLFEPQRSDFRMLANQVEGNMEYSFQEGDTKTPITFLNELKTQSASPTTVSPMATSNLIVTSAATPSKISTSAVVYSRMVFNSSSPVPTESLVLNATNTLLNSRRANLSDSIKVLNVTYEKISETSYAVIFTFNISDISMPESTVLMNDTYTQVKNSVNIALNTLLNEPSADLFEPQRSDFRMLANQVEGNMEYSFQEGDTKTPITFLNELKTQSASPTTVSPMATSNLIVTSAATPSKISTSAVVYSRMVFNSSSPVPTESLVLNATNTLLNSRRANLSDSIKVLNVTYEKISETSYAVIFTFNISDISMPESTVLMNDTYTQVKNSVNIALNTLLNEPSADLFEPQRSDFRMLANQVEGNMEYSFQEGDTKTPITFLNELKTQSASPTTVSPMATSNLIVTSAATPSKISTSAVVYSRMVFNSSSPVPTESLVLNATNTLLNSRRANLSDSIKVLNVTYEKISETSYAVIFTFNISDISMPESTVLMNDTYIQVKNSVNIALNTLLNEPSADLFEPQRSDFRMLANQVEGNMEYSFQEGDTKTPITFLNELKTQSASPTTVSPMATSNLIVTSAATPSKISTSAVVYSRMVFNSSSPVPTESLVLNATNTLLNSRRANLSDSIKVLNVTYEKISETSYAVIFTFNISDISMPESTVLMNDTYTQVKNSVNIALNTLLNEPSADLFEPQRSDFRMLANQVEGNMEYSFQEGDTKTPITFLNELKTQSASPTTVSPMATSNLIVTSAATPSKISTSAVVYSRMVFNSSSPVPTESLVLNATNTLLNSRRANLSDSIKVLNVTYEKISETSYAVIFTFNISDISMPESTVLMNDTYTQVKNSVNIALNTLLNEPSADLFEPQRSDFRMLANQVEGNMEYSFQEGDTKTPITFLNELKTQSASPTTVSPMATSNLIVTSAATPSKISTSAVVYSRMVFNSSSPVPTESLVLNATNTLLNSRRANLSDSIKVLNVTYEKISETSYAVIFTFNISDISMPESTVLMNDTYTQVKNSVNIALNTLLNEPSADLFEPQRSDFRMLANQVEGNMEYSFQEGDTKTPITFLNELKTQSASPTTVSPMATSNLIVTSAATPSKISTSAVVYSRMVFNSSSPVPTESLVLNATNTLLNSRRANLSDSIKVLNVTYEKISETSYAVIFTFNISDISMPESTVLMNDTYTQVKNSVNIALNTLLNEPSADLFEPQRSDFRMLANQVEGNMEYSFQEGDTKTPITFLNELKTQSASPTTVSPMATSNLIVTSAATPSKISTSAVVYSRMVFNSSSPVPTESLVLNATNTLLNSRRANLSDSIKVLNVTYEKISETSYAVIFTFNISDISMPESTVLMNDTYIQVKNSVNIALNTLLNEPSADLFEPQRSDFRMLANQVEGNMEYSFQEGDTKTPITFLNELKTQSASPTTVSPMATSNLIVTSAATPSKISTSAVVYSRMVFNSSSPVPTESLVLNATNTLLNSRRANLSDSIKVLNVTYEKISETSYAVIFTFNISDISMPESTVLMNDTYTQVKNSVNIALNTLLNEPSADLFEPQRSDFRMLANQVEGNMEYSFQEGDTKTPITFLNKLKTQSASPTTVSPMATSNLIVTSAATPSKISTSAVVYSRLVFNSSSPVPTESLVLNATNTLLNSRRANLSDSTKVLNVTYEKISETSYAVIFTFNVSNISMPESTVLMNDTYTQVKNSVNIALNTLLNEPGADLFEPQRSDFRMLANQVESNMEYSFQDGDTKTPISFLNELKTQSGDTPTVPPTASTALQSTTVLTPEIMTTSVLEKTTSTIMEITTSPTLEITTAPTLEITTASPQQITAAPTLMGSVLIYIRLVFKNLTTLPSEAEVLNAANTLLDSGVRMKRDVSTQKLNNPVSIQNVTYQKTSSNSYTISFAFKISNVSISKNIELRNETYDAIQNTINGLLNKILNDPNATPFVFQRANYTGNDTVIQADAEYIFMEGDIKTPSGFLKEILKISGLAGGGFPGWALAIIIPCGIAIILVPCWIILCIMLSGCCGAVRRRWHRRRSYNVQYPIHNSLF
ncbi:LOW QUALITY PROTEIN: mucin-17-like [Colossoma macropomum]|uniref:LOW QUALITY PROTEIN: mucin-17-like n=1 Tax=Colossoma macropomum TaxID=42526 RepID=UPI0018646CA4|nr:LOW QUALITY PROTEIN: mucin-17-like [Colossoma macropomum]